MAAKIDKLLGKVTQFVDPKLTAKNDTQTRVLKTVDLLTNNADVFLDKIEQFGEKKKKFAFVAKEETTGNINPGMRFDSIKTRNQNDSKFPFIPLIRVKPHSLTPISPLILQAAANPETFFRNVLSPENYEFDCPYENEVKALAVPTFLHLEHLFANTQLDKSLVGKFMFIDDETKLQEAVQEINKHTILSVDLEFHLEHSFQGFSCLIQMSTVESDYVIDPLVLFDKLGLLNTVFANPGILKLFHGCDSDVIMLQKDFGIYIVNMLDTYQIAKRMNHASNSLGSLIQFGY